MKIKHHNLDVELPDEWLEAAGANQVRSTSIAYSVESSSVGSADILLIPIIEIAAVCRAPGVPIFNYCGEQHISAKERTTRILRAMVNGVPLPPVKIAQNPTQDSTFELRDGTHRLYCSIALGYTHIPAIEPTSTNS